MATDTETRRGLKVHRPKGQPFSYTVERRKNAWGAPELAVLVKVDGYWPDDSIRIQSWPEMDANPVEAEVAHGAGGYGGGEDGIDGLTAIDNFARALRWAVRYARRWNKKHGLSEKGE